MVAGNDLDGLRRHGQGHEARGQLFRGQSGGVDPRDRDAGQHAAGVDAVERERGEDRHGCDDEDREEREDEPARQDPEALQASGSRFRYRGDGQFATRRTSGFRRDDAPLRVARLGMADARMVHGNASGRKGRNVPLAEMRPLTTR